MPNIREQSTVNRIAEVFCGEGKRNKTETLKMIGYGKGYAEGTGHVPVFGNVRVIAAIKAIDEAKEAKEDYNYHLAMTGLRSDLALLDAMTQTPQVIRDKLGIRKEMNDITGLHKNIVVDETGHQLALDEKQQAEARRLAGIRLRQGASEPPGELN